MGITFDYAPANIIFGILWNFVCTLVCLHVALFIFRLRSYYPKYSKVVMASYIIGPVFVVMFTTMTISLLVPPSQSIVGHTVPYQILIVGTSMWWIFNGIVISTWPTKLP